MPERILHLHVDPCTTHRTQIVYVSFLRARRFIHMLRHVRSMFDNCNRLRRTRHMTAHALFVATTFFRTRRRLVHDPRIAVPQRVLHLHVDPCTAHRTQIVYVSFLRARRLVHMSDPVRRMFSQRDRFRRARRGTPRAGLMTAAFRRTGRRRIYNPCIVMTERCQRLRISNTFSAIPTGSPHTAGSRARRLLSMRFRHFHCTRTGSQRRTCRGSRNFTGMTRRKNTDPEKNTGNHQYAQRERYQQFPLIHFVVLPKSFFS